ncbi:regulator of chromosome condensation 1/beta-lactamase-inhibitor protein II [Lentinula raphanica]|nr:regulator of chromosome condensation 1/beta-lactamase-inhibitor protein II [Lentinula raphanica]
MSAHGPFRIPISLTLMFRLRPLRSTRSFSTYSRQPHSRQRLVATTAVVAASVLVYAGLKHKPIHNDSLPPTNSFKPEYNPEKPKGPRPNSDDTLNTLVWGSNSSQKLLPGDSKTDSIRSPTTAKWLDNVALRDLALHSQYAVCVDARGDVYQWGQGVDPSPILKGQNIVQIQPTDARIYALSRSGKIYALDADLSRHSSSEPASTKRLNSPWWSTGWIWGEEVVGSFQEIIPRTQLSWGEKFISISAGKDHLLGLTSSGRAFAHPINSNANAYGQLGFRKFDVPDISSPQSKERIPVELVPKSVKDPYAKASPFRRRNSDTEETAEKNRPAVSFPFSPNIFEIPSLQGIKLSQLVAGGRSSFALTSTGRVLGWGANEYGQIGLGDNVTLDTITVPTEVILWRMAQGAQTKCLNVSAGGDLTCFTVERTTQADTPRSSSTIELLLSGNGQYGSLGNNLYTNTQGNPIRARNVSNLTEYDDETNSLRPIAPHSISVSSTGHVLLTLSSNSGRDLLAWGRNYNSELGNGKRAGLAVPTTLADADGERFLLQRKRAKEVLDLQGVVWKRGVEVEQKAVAGYDSSAVFWKVST